MWLTVCVDYNEKSSGLAQAQQDESVFVNRVIRVVDDTGAIVKERRLRFFE